MKFLITGTPEQIEKMQKDLDAEISKVTKLQRSPVLKAVSKLTESITGGAGLLLNMGYAAVSPTQMKLDVTMSAEAFMAKGKIRNMIKDRAAGYGDNVRVEAV